MWKYFIYKFGQFCVKNLPLKVSYRLATFISDIQFLVSFRDRRSVRNNLSVILSSPVNMTIQVREVFRNFGRYLVEFFRMRYDINEEYVRKNISLNNFAYIQDELKKGKGAIILTAHIGNWEMGAAVLGVLGYPPIAIALPHKERPVNTLFNQQRETYGVEVVPVRFAVRRCLETLKSNGVVALLADRDFSGNGIILDFLGKKTLIPKGAAALSYRTGAPIIPMFLLRVPGLASFSLIAEKPIYPPSAQESGVEEDILKGIMKQYTVIIEEKIRQFPTQWLMFREFWIKG